MHSKNPQEYEITISLENMQVQALIIIISSYSKPIQKAIDRELQGNYARGQNRVVNLLNKFKQLFGIDNIAESNILIPEDIEKSQIEREHIAKIFNRPKPPPQEESFFGVNYKKLEALRKSVTD